MKLFHFTADCEFYAENEYAAVAFLRDHFQAAVDGTDKPNAGLKAGSMHIHESH